MYVEELYKRISPDELQQLTREIELCRDAGGDWEYQEYLGEYVAAKIYTEIEVEFATYPKSGLYEAYVRNAEGGYAELGYGHSKTSFWAALRSALVFMGLAKIEPEQEW